MASLISSYHCKEECIYKLNLNSIYLPSIFATKQIVLSGNFPTDSVWNLQVKYDGVK